MSCFAYRRLLQLITIELFVGYQTTSNTQKNVQVLIVSACFLQKCSVQLVELNQIQFWKIDVSGVFLHKLSSKFVFMIETYLKIGLSTHQIFFWETTAKI